MAKKESESLQRIKADLQSPDKAVAQRARFSVLVEAANRGGENGPEVRELRKFLDENKDLARQYQVFAFSVRHGLMRKMTHEPGHFELLEREYETRRDNLGWANAGPTERLMIERIMLCWLRLIWYENYNGSFMQPGVHMRESEYADKMLGRAYSRYVKAIESLAKLRQAEAIIRAASAQASILEMKEKTTRARIEAAHPGLLSEDRGLKAVLRGALKAG
jgi:hypothetical protein